MSLVQFTQLYSTENDQKIAEDCRKIFSALLNSMKLPENLIDNLQNLYIPFVNLLKKQNYLQAGSIPVVGISGSQGSGKSTFTTLLTNLLEKAYGYRVASFSIDDFYHTRATRETLSHTIHKLLITRGVPGTHDVKTGFKVINSLLRTGNNTITNIPVFDKSIDDRKTAEEWNHFKGRPDIILFEGWCVGAAPQSPEELSLPVNGLEKEHDPDQRFRRFVNDQLSGDYKKWFSMIDFLVMLKVPSFEQVYEWRWLQEKKLKEKTRTDAIHGKKLRIMTKDQVLFFISHYERITRHLLKELPGRANLILEVGTDHSFKNIII